jgi:MFS family permease
VAARERYGRVLRAPHVGGLWVAATVARLPIGINGLALVLAVRHTTGSFGIAGAATGAYALTLGVASPLQARLMDRHGPRRVIPRFVVGNAIVWVVFVAVLGHVPAWVIVALAALAGLGLPPLSPVMRAMWPRLLGDASLVTTAFALDAAIVEMVFILGPLLVAGIGAVSGASAALLASAGLVLLGSGLLVSSPPVRAWEPEIREGRNPFGPLTSPGVLTIVLATLPAGFGIGAMEIALPAFATAHGTPGRSGLLIAVWAAGSGVGALFYGARDWEVPLNGRWLVVSSLLGGVFFLPLGAPSIVALLPLLLPTGMFIAPLLASGGQLIGELAPPGMTAEAYSWGPTAIVVGAAAGSAAAGALVEASSWRAAIVAAAVSTLAGAAIGIARRRTLRPHAMVI